MIPSIYTAIANPGTPADPRPFAGDPFEAAPPLIERLREVLEHTQARIGDHRLPALRRLVNELGETVPGPVDITFDRIVKDFQRYLDANSVQWDHLKVIDGPTAGMAVNVQYPEGLRPFVLHRYARMFGFRDLDDDVSAERVLGELPRTTDRVVAVRQPLPSWSPFKGASLNWSGLPVRLMLGYNQIKGCFLLSVDVLMTGIVGNHDDFTKDLPIERL